MEPLDIFEKGFLQTNRSNLQGNLWASFGLDLQSNLGALRLSPRLQVNTASVANQGLSVAFAMFDQMAWTVAGTRVFKNSAFNLISPFTEDASTGAITSYVATESDMVVFNSTLCTSADLKIMSKVANGLGTGAWTLRATLSVGCAHKLLSFKKLNRLYYIDNYTQIKSLDTAWSEATSGSYFIDLTYSSGIPFALEQDETNIWIGTVNQTPSGVLDFSRGASILTWDGTSSTITSDYRIKAQGVLALCKDEKGIMHAIDSSGKLLAFNGSGFSEVGRLPLNRKQLVNAASGLYNSFIHPNGFKLTANGTFQVLVNNVLGDSGSTIQENLPSGVWEWHKDTGFIHKQAITYTPVGTTTVTDYGQNRLSAVGALANFDVYSASASGKPTIICGATYYTDASTTTSGIFIDDPLDTTQKYGYFVTSWLRSNVIKQNWGQIWLFFRQLLNSTDEFILKYRSVETTATEISITWTSTTTFTTTTNILGKEGYEVEGIQGTGSCKTAHITRIDLSGSTYTATIDEAITGVTGTAKVRLQNWLKLGTMTTQTADTDFFTLIKSFYRVQFKLCMQFTGENELFTMKVVNSPQQSI